MAKVYIKCPYCDSVSIALDKGKRTYYCNDCGMYFTNDDVLREDLRHQISAILMDTSEENPRICDIVIGEEEACGLSTLEMPRIIKCFDHYDGTQWFLIEGCEDYTEGDELSTNDLRTILEGLKG